MPEELSTKGLENHYKRSLSEVENVLDKWNNGGFENNRDAYMTLYKAVEKNDKNIGRIYNDKGGSRYLEIISMQLADGVITEEDLKEFPERIRDVINFLTGK